MCPPKRVRSRPQQSILDNLFLPQQKLTSKTRTGAKVTKTYDHAATPYTRLTRDHPQALNPHDRVALDTRLTEINPAELRRKISAVQATLLELGRRRGKVPQRPKANATYLSKRKITPPTRAKTDESTTHTTRAS